MTSVEHKINPFTAMLAAPSVGKRQTTLPHLPPSREHVKGVMSKCTVLRTDLLYYHHTHCLEARMCDLLSPEILQAEAVKGLIFLFADSVQALWASLCL